MHRCDSECHGSLSGGYSILFTKLGKSEARWIPRFEHGGDAVVLIRLATIVLQYAFISATVSLTELIQTPASVIPT